jgi:heptosyltransferase-2
MAKFLIIRFSSIGDIVLTTPVVRCLRKALPDAEIHYLTKSSYRDILTPNPYINKLHFLGNDWDGMLNELKNESFDFIIDLHHNIRTLKIKSALKGIPSFSFNKLNARKFLYTNFKINTMPAIHIVDRYLDTIKSFGAVNDGLGLDYFIPENDCVPKTDIPASHQSGYIGLVIGATWNTKKLPVEMLMELCRSIDHPILLLGGKEDYLMGKQIADVDDIKIYNACGKFRLNESADLVRNAKFIISHDTGLMHIAAAFQKPVISVWGNTVPAFGMFPYYGNKSNVKSDRVEVLHLWCRPCSKIGYNKCPLVHLNCLKKINISGMIQLVNQYLGR